MEYNVLYTPLRKPFLFKQSNEFLNLLHQFLNLGKTLSTANLLAPIVSPK